MHDSRSPLIAALCSVALFVCAESHAAESKDKPKTGDLPFGQVVLVDDDTCPKGEIKEITGGSQEKGVRRSVRCIKRPGS
jgi:hypothetical protein